MINCKFFYCAITTALALLNSCREKTYIKFDNTCPPSQTTLSVISSNQLVLFYTSGFYLIDIQDGPEVKWHTNLSNKMIESYYLTDSSIYLHAKERNKKNKTTLFAYSLNKKNELWRSNVNQNSALSNLQFDVEKNILFIIQPEYDTLVIDPITGENKAFSDNGYQLGSLRDRFARSDLESYVVFTKTKLDEHLVSDEKTLERRDHAGSVIWRKKYPSRYTIHAINEDYLALDYYSKAGRNLELLNKKDGTVLRSQVLPQDFNIYMSDNFFVLIESGRIKTIYDLIIQETITLDKVHDPVASLTIIGNKLILLNNECILQIVSLSELSLAS